MCNPIEAEGIIPHRMGEKERTLVLIKPDGVRRKLVGEVIKRLEARELTIVGLKLLHPERELVETHYAEHREKPFFGHLVNYLTSGAVVALAVEGENAIQAVRIMIGATNPAEAAAGTIRGDFALTIEENIVHGSADRASAEKELAIWFSDEELIY